MHEMKILIVSDSHGCLDWMEEALHRESPDCCIHLGDLWEDAAELQRRHPTLRLLQVAGNCDRWSYAPGRCELMTPALGGVQFYITHGHLHQVKQTLLRLELAARESGARVALFGHTHRSFAEEKDGLLLLNPGACGSGAGSYGVICIENGNILYRVSGFRPDAEDRRRIP